jgi:hypothetical protein
MTWGKDCNVGIIGKKNVKKIICSTSLVLFMIISSFAGIIGIGLSNTIENDIIIEEPSGTRGTSRAVEELRGTSQWDTEVIANFDYKTSGCTIGDLDPTHDGNEAITVNGDGLVAMAYKTASGKWTTKELWQGQGELLTPIIDNFYEGHKGNELLVVGMGKGPENDVGAGHATMIWGSGDNWNAELIFNNTDSMLHGAAVGDLDPTHKDNEVIVMSFGYDVKMLTWVGPTAADWNVTQMWHAEGKVRKGLIDNFDPNHDGNELVVVDKSGNCTMIYGSGTNWTAETLWTDPGTPGLARVAVGDADPTYSGKEIVVGGDSNNVGIIRRTGETWDGDVIYTDSDKIRGVGIGDVDPTHKGNEILVFAYSNNVTMLTGSGDNWKSRVLFTDTGRSHDLTIGEIDPDHTGLEIIFTGYSNNITMLGVSPWYYDITFKDEYKISGCTIGDLDPTHPGNEIVTVSGTGRVVLIYETAEGTWKHRELWQGGGELITAVIGEFYSEHKGNELLVVGMGKGPENDVGAGHASMIYGSGDTWKVELMFNNTDSMLHGAAVGDLDPKHDGNEVVVMSFGYDAKMLTWEGPKATDWQATQMWHAEGKVRKGVIDDIDPSHPGNELIVVDKSGNCTMLYGTGTNWTAETLWTDPGTPGLARVAVGDADPTYAGKEVVVGGDSNNVGIIRRTGTGWEGEVIFTDTDKIRGLGIGDVDPRKPGNEILVFGYSNKVTMLSGSGSSWESKLIYTDTGRAHDLAVGEFNSHHPGQEILAVGYSNSATMIMNSELTQEPDFNIYAYPSSFTAYSGETVDFTIGVLSLGGFNQQVQLSVSGLGAELSSNIYPNTIIPDATSTLTITIPITNIHSDETITITATSGDYNQTTELQFKVLGDTAGPEIESTFPVDNSEVIPIETPILIRFSEPMDEYTITESTVTILEDETATKYTGSIQYDKESDTLIIGGLTLPYSKLIRVTLDPSIADLAGNTLESKYQFKFLTVPEDTKPTVYLPTRRS